MKALILPADTGGLSRPLELGNKPVLLHQIEGLAKPSPPSTPVAASFRAALLADPAPLLVLRGDVVCDYPFEQLRRFHTSHGGEGSVVIAAGAEGPARYGLVVTGDGSTKVERFVERLQERAAGRVNAAIYMFNASVLDKIEASSLHALSHAGFWVSVTRPEDLVGATRLYLAHLSERAPDALVPGYGGNVLIDPTARIGQGCRVGPDVVIGAGAVVGDGVRLRECVVMAEAEVGDCAWIKESVVGWRANVGKWDLLETICRLPHLFVPPLPKARLENVSLDSATTIPSEAHVTGPSTPPSHNATSPIDISLFNTISEGSATILFPKNNEVFYNPVQQFNRDMSIAAIRIWSKIYLEEKREKVEKKKKNRTAGRSKTNTETTETGEEGEKEGEPMDVDGTTKFEGAHATPSPFHINTTDFTILEALSASGLRSIRYAKEIPNVRYILANDLEQDAVNSIRRNVAYNGLTEDLVRPNKGDAMAVMYAHREEGKRFDVIDLDPYGTASPFIDGAVQALADGGLLCVTCTDLAILTGSTNPETWQLLQIRWDAPEGHVRPRDELTFIAILSQALRLVLQTIQTSAARYRRYIVPLASCSIDFYVRIFLRVFTSAVEVKNVSSKMSMAYGCVGCSAFTTQPLGKVQTTEKGHLKYNSASGPTLEQHCQSCGSIHHVGGPIWGAAIHDQTFVKQMLDHLKANKEAYHTSARMQGMLTVIGEELDIPFYWTLGKLTGTLRCNSIPMVSLCSAILNQGYKVSISHCSPESIKTNAPTSVVWDVLRGWVGARVIRFSMFMLVLSSAPIDPTRHVILSSGTGQTASCDHAQYWRGLTGEVFEANFTKHPDAIPESRNVKLLRFQVNPERNWGPKARAGKGKGKGSGGGTGAKKRKMDKEETAVDAGGEEPPAKKKLSGGKG
ncbi:hypothetical protein BC937DRAFT_91357 [Endogone sp. FLAS-F59071]|nr:hypothetical protein BC937DRAFT_91357 [Endogone sp. FLAS-F59071]|eukprot:RUS21827.1 hypothetical protein BC937DRAFT_91357 [Endogone sp. FLAS-F59071]